MSLFQLESHGFDDSSQMPAMTNTMDTMQLMGGKMMSQSLTVDTAVSSRQPQELMTPLLSARTLQGQETSEAGLQFYPTVEQVPVVSSDGSKQYAVNIAAKMDKRGFLFENGEFICYRRNYFHLLASFNLDTGNNASMPTPPLDGLLPMDDFGYSVELNGEIVPVHGFKMSVSAHIVGLHSKQVPLVQFTSKRDKSDHGPPTPQALHPGGDVGEASVYHMLASAHAHGGLKRVANFDRLQFKAATANNGKKRASQQRFAICVELHAVIGDEVDGSERMHKIAYMESMPVMVRGRSPGHYANSPRSSPYSMSERLTPPSASMMLNQSFSIQPHPLTSFYGQMPHLDAAIMNQSSPTMELFEPLSHMGNPSPLTEEALFKHLVGYEESASY